jgi:hypothetical protein
LANPKDFNDKDESTKETLEQPEGTDRPAIVAATESNDMNKIFNSIEPLEKELFLETICLGSSRLEISVIDPKDLDIALTDLKDGIVNEAQIVIFADILKEE